MSKKELQRFLSELNKAELQAQVIDLYSRFKEVKTFYDFSFHPNELQLRDEAIIKIKKEYFPEGEKKAKLRPSTAQKLIKKFKKLEVNPDIIAEVMFYNIEAAQGYYSEKPIRRKNFYNSMLNSFQELVLFTDEHGLYHQFSERLDKMVSLFYYQEWPTAEIMSNFAVRYFSHK